jgi:hypothetical protein
MILVLNALFACLNDGICRWKVERAMMDFVVEAFYILA